MQRKWVQAYTGTIIVIGLVLVFWGGFTAITENMALDPAEYIQRTLFLTAICAVCRSMPIFLTKNKTLDLSVISILMTYLTYGTAQAIFIYALSSLVTFSHSEEEGRRISCIYNTSPVKSLFNIGSVVIAVAVPAFVCDLTGWQAGQFIYPQILLVTVIFAALTFLVNALIMMGLFSMIDGLSRYEALHMLLGLIPNVLPVMPLGYVMALFLRQENGVLLVLFMLLPLWLARHGWKLYVDSINQQQRLVDALNVSMEARDAYTSGHAKRVSEYAMLISREMGLGVREIYTIQRGALLHDVARSASAIRCCSSPASSRPRSASISRPIPSLAPTSPRRSSLTKRSSTWCAIITSALTARAIPTNSRGKTSPATRAYWPWPTRWTPCSPTAPTARAWRWKRRCASSARPRERSLIPEWSPR